MGLLQEIEGLLGFGKKANQTSQDAAAVSAAITVVEGWVSSTKAVVSALTPFAAENPVFAVAIGAANIVLADAQAVLSWLKSLVPVSPPASPPAAK